MVNEYSAEIFDLKKENFDSFAELITQAFLSDEAAQKEGTTVVFDTTTFRRIFGSPYLENQLIIRVIHQPSGAMVGFMGGLPRNLCFNEKKNNSLQSKHVRVIVPSWAAVHPDHKRKGVGSLMVSKFIEAASKRGFMYSYAIFEPEQNGIDLGNATADRNSDVESIKWFNINWFIIRAFDIPAVRKVMKLKFYERWIIRLISPPRTPSPEPMKNGCKVRLFKSQDKAKLFDLLDEYTSTKNAAIIKNREDFNWYMDQPGISCCVHEDNSGTVNGFVLAWEFSFAGFGKIIPFGWLDLVNVDHLSRRSAANLIRFFNIQAKHKGWKGIQTPYIPYFPIKPFLGANYLTFPKKMIVQVFGLKNSDLSFFRKAPDTCFLDWR
ncbi:GNAT family N-acetyltransferase [bacterium]|nr:GNAT family N-acetyltransferase [bacterium]